MRLTLRPKRKSRRRYVYKRRSYIPKLKPDEYEKEVWKVIHRFKYQVSNMGRVRRYQRKIMKPSFCLAGLQVVLYKRNKGKAKLVRNLVADAFLPPFGVGRVIVRDGDETNCRVSNLKRINTGLHHAARLTPASKAAIIEALRAGVPRGGQKLLAEQYNVTPKTISIIKKQVLNASQD